jgi:hypothetical protein
MSKHTTRWNDRPDKGDFEAALDYLTLRLPGAKAGRASRARKIHRTAKEVLRASNLPNTPVTATASPAGECSRACATARSATGRTNFAA